MKKVKNSIIAAALTLSSMLAVAAIWQPQSVVAASGIEQVRQGAKSAQTGDDSTSDIPSMVQRVVNVMLFVLGAVAVIMIVLGGIKFTTSNGNPEQIKSAKNTIMYSVVGLVVAIMAYAIVNFVVTQITSSGGGGGGAESSSEEGSE